MGVKITRSEMVIIFVTEERTEAQLCRSGQTAAAPSHGQILSQFERCLILQER